MTRTRVLPLPQIINKNITNQFNSSGPSAVFNVNQAFTDTTGTTSFKRNYAEKSVDKKVIQKRKPNLDYLNEGEGPVIYDDSTKNWCLQNGLNLSEKLHDFRDRSIQHIAENNGPANVYEELHHYRIGQEDFETATLEVLNNYVTNAVCDNMTGEIKKISKLSKINGDGAIDQADIWCSNSIVAKNKMEKKIARVVSSVLRNIQMKKVQRMKEPLFCSQLIEPIVCPFLSESEDVVLKGSSEESTGSKARRGKEGRIPDLSLCVEVKGFQHALFLCEVKTISYMNSENSSPDPDFIKLINEMKDELDNMGDVKDESRVVYSLLVQGILLKLSSFFPTAI
ncbi:hypothetical protein BDF21DRAFT_145107 [Thamnidium elegans]|nr:hypothetical protein BDF21DRAFT_145107 [Thamnidium elegans]